MRRIARALSLLTIDERAIGTCMIRLLSGKETAPLTKAAINALSPIKIIHTITADNGKRFSFHETIADKLNILFTLQNNTTHREKMRTRI